MKTITTSGQLIYLVGSSGAGKDTVLNEIRTNRPVIDGESVCVMHRYITRPSHIGNESHISLTDAEFFDRQQLGLFAMNWEAHNTKYAIGSEVNHWLEKGVTVVINGSRAYFSEALKRYPSMKMVWITVDSQVLEKRLIDRGRENFSEIQQRILRNNELDNVRPDDCLTIDNSGDINSTLMQFSKLLSAINER